MDPSLGGNTDVDTNSMIKARAKMKRGHDQASCLVKATIQTAEVLRLRSAGVPSIEVARQFGVAPQGVSQAVGCRCMAGGDGPNPS